MSSLFLSKNLKYLRIKEKYSQELLADKLGVTRGQYKEYELNTFPKPDMLFALADFYNVSLDQLLRVDLEAEAIEKEKNSRKSISELKTKEGKILVVTIDGFGRENVEFVPIKAKAGYLEGYSNPLFVESLPKYRFPHLPIGTYRAFEIQGDSMPPVSDKSIVIGRYIENANLIKNLDTYILVTKEEGVVYKRVINKSRTQQQLVLISDNPYYAPYTIPTQEVHEIWAYHCHVAFDGDNSSQKHVLKEIMNMANEITLED